MDQKAFSQSRYNRQFVFRPVKLNGVLIDDYFGEQTFRYNLYNNRLSHTGHTVKHPFACNKKGCPSHRRNDKGWMKDRFNLVSF